MTGKTEESVKDNAVRINALSAELMNCRDEERNTHGHIVQVISTAGTLLGLLTGASVFGAGPESETSSFFLNTLLFWLSIFIFITVFSYIVTLGVKNVLRYYHIQDIENRLYKLAPDGQNSDDDFIYWESLCAPVITRNPRHIASSYGALHYLNFSFAVLGTVAFSVLMVLIQYMTIPVVTWYNRAGLFGTFGVIGVSLLLFLCTTSDTKYRVNKLREIARNRIEARLEGGDSAVYSGAAEVYRLVCYFIYPKATDLQKPLLVVLGLIGGILLSLPVLKWDMALKSILNLLYALMVFDFLAYQARYLINDIRGMGEDKNRLVSSDGTKSKLRIQVALIIASMRLALAVVMTACATGRVRLLLSVALGILLINTIGYELARKHQRIWPVYLLVGSGYPLRFFLGLFIADLPLYPIPLWCHIGLAVALWFFGSCASILSWANEVTGVMQWAREKGPTGQFPREYKKKHFGALQENLRERYSDAELQLGNGRVLPLRESGRLRDPWNITYAAMLIGLLISFSTLHPVSANNILEIGAFICLLATVWCSQCIIIVLLCAGCLLTVAMGYWSCGAGNSAWYAFLCGVQLMCAITCFGLRYSIEFKPFPFKKIFGAIIRAIVGESAWDVLSQKDGVRNAQGLVDRKEDPPPVPYQIKEV